MSHHNHQWAGKRCLTNNWLCIKQIVLHTLTISLKYTRASGISKYHHSVEGMRDARFIPRVPPCAAFLKLMNRTWLDPTAIGSIFSQVSWSNFIYDLDKSSNQYFNSQSRIAIPLSHELTNSKNLTPFSSVLTKTKTAYPIYWCSYYEAIRCPLVQ